VKKRSLFNVVKIRPVAFALKLYGIEILTVDSVYWRIAIIYSVWNAYENGVHRPAMRTESLKLGKKNSSDERTCSSY
jgi:hypothetical protein